MLIETTKSGPVLKVSANVTLGDFSVKKDGRVFFRLDVPTTCTFDAIETVKLAGKMLVCVAQYAVMSDGEEIKTATTKLGCVMFAGISIKKQGESILVLESHEDALSVTLGELRNLREKDMRLSLVYFPANEEVE